MIISIANITIPWKSRRNLQSNYFSSNRDFYRLGIEILGQGLKIKDLKFDDKLILAAREIIFYDFDVFLPTAFYEIFSKNETSE